MGVKNRKPRKISLSRPVAARASLRSQRLKKAAKEGAFPVFDRSTGKTRMLSAETMHKPLKGVRSKPISGGETRGDRRRQGARVKKMSLFFGIKGSR
jgi:hypothetical protein